MKKWLAAALCALLLAQGSVCAAQESLTDAAERVLSLLAAGEYAAVTAQFDEAMANALNDQMLESVWKSVTAQLGEVSGVLAVEEDEASRSAAMTIEHENGSSVMVMAFDEEGRIAGMNVVKLSAAAQIIARALPDGVEARPIALFSGTERELAGELLIPAGADESTPYVVLAQGSGPSDMDETIGANKPFRDLAYDLAMQGVGSLRFDKITYAHPEIPVKTVEQEYLEPVREALSVLRNEADAKRVYLVGHSQGGMLAPYLVKACGFDGGAALAGTPWQLWEISYAQNLALLESVKQAPEYDVLRLQVEAEREKALTLTEMTQEEAAGTTVFGVSAVYQRHLALMDQAQIALESEKPFLFLWGERDFQVERAAFEAWGERLGDDGRFTYRTYPGLNHLFMPANEEDSILNAQAAYQRPAQMDAQVAQDVAAWIFSL